MPENPSFIDELFHIPELNCKDNKEIDSISNYCGIAILTQEPDNEWSASEKGMLSKIISLCGHEISNCEITHFTNSLQFSEHIQAKSTNYIILFSSKENVKDLQVQLKPLQWTILGDKKVFFNPQLSVFAGHTKAKKLFWTALQEEFEKAKNFKA